MKYWIGLFCLYQAFWVTGTNAQEVTSDIIDVFQQEDLPAASCYRIPSVIYTPSDLLIVAVDERIGSCADLNKNQDINIVIRKSADQGTNWSEIERIVDYPFGESASDPSMILDRQRGTLLLFFNYMNHKEEPGMYQIKMIKSMDHGKTWTQPIDITSQIMEAEWKKDFVFLTSGQGFQDTEGSMYHTLVHLKYGVFVILSKDGGNTWQRISTPLNPADESKIVVLKQGTWLINSRVNQVGYRFEHRSDDQGKTWITKPSTQLIDSGCNAGFEYLLPDASRPQGLLLFTNPRSSTTRENLSLQWSYDKGSTWPGLKTIYTGSAAYSTTVQLNQSSIGIVFERDQYSTISFIKLPRSTFD